LLRSSRTALACFNLLLVCLAMLAGCNREAAAPREEQPETIDSRIPDLPSDTVAADKHKIVLGFSQLGSESDWRNANTRSIQEAAKEAGIELLFDNAEQSQEKQIEAIRRFIERKVDVIAFAPVIETGWEDILTEARQAGIPVILSDRAVQISDPSLYVTFIGADFYEEGRKAGKYLLDKKRNDPGPVVIAELQGTEGSSPSIERGRGFRDVIRERADMTIAYSAPADFTVAKGAEVMRGFLRESGGGIDVLFAHNDDMALGAIEAIEEFGLKPGEDIVIISVDGTRKAFEMMAEGKINCVVECNPLLGPILMQAVREIYEGRTLPKRIVPPESVFTEVLAEKEVANRQY
jgi:ABC-type sugar transport system substrate-binding protein